MHLVVDKVVQLEEVHNADRNRVLEIFACLAVARHDFRRNREPRLLELLFDLLLRRRLEDVACVPFIQGTGCPPQFGLHNLPDIHPRRNAQRVEADIERRAVFEIGHVLDGKHAGDNTFVAVAACHLIAFFKLALDGDKHFDGFFDAGREIVIVGAGHALDIDDRTLDAMRHAQG